MAALELSGRQAKYLRGLAHDKKAVVQVGGGGVTDAVIAAVKEALLAHELIKVKMREPEDKKRMAEALAAKSGAGSCGLVGHTVILYRPLPDKPRIHVPQG